ncbi:GNAT family N-acetyltransferase [Dasania marina]|uniref:GNAT family N-acetyltransferase n=1 Tax=Dasania marina TaxID=471499 RepID=UPI0003748AA4|nr:GNAT family N-acetyltransferase [Dasania marina]
MTEQTLAIRPATLNDAQALADFNSAMAMETEHMTLAPEVILAGVRNLITNPHRGFYLVAEVEDKVVASLMVTTEWSDWRNGEFWWVQSVYVQAAWRRQGLYTRLYNKVKQLAQQQGDVCGFRLYVEQDNHIAQQTYKQVGMAETHYKLFEEIDA